MKTEMQRLCERYHIHIECHYGGNKGPPPDAWQCHPYRVKLWRYVDGKKRTISVDFFCGMAWNAEPRAADVLSSLVSDASSVHESFEDWCANYGYDTDSRKAERTYKACQELAPKVLRFLGDEADLFAGAEH